MPFFRLKVGTAEVAHPDDPKKSRIVKSTDPDNNWIESDQDLAAKEPHRYEYIERPPAAARLPKREISRDPAPPPPPTEVDRLVASLTRPMSAEERKKAREQLQKQLEILDEQAAANEKARLEDTSDPADTPESEGTDFESMRVAELREFAEKNEVDLDGAHTKADIVAKLQEWEANKK